MARIHYGWARSLSIVELRKDADDFGLYTGGRDHAFPKYPKGQSRNDGSPLNTPLAARGPLPFVLAERDKWERAGRRI